MGIESVNPKGQIDRLSVLGDAAYVLETGRTLETLGDETLRIDHTEGRHTRGFSVKKGASAPVGEAGIDGIGFNNDERRPQG